MTHDAIAFDIFAVQRIGDRWRIVSPAEEPTRAPYQWRVVETPTEVEGFASVQAGPSHKPDCGA